MSRREFLGAGGALAGALGVSQSWLGAVLAAEPQRGAGPTTLDATIVAGGGGGRYRKLVWGPGEPFLVREDLGVGVAPGRERTRASLLYFAQVSDTHITDAQSPGRFEFAEAFWRLGTDAAACAYESMTVQVLDELVRAVNAVPASPVTGAPLAFCVVTGDNVDNAHLTELRWYIDTLDGKTVVADSGRRGVYEGVQAMGGLGWAYHPDDPSGDEYGVWGFPAYPGLLEASTAPVATAGLNVPWYAVFGNHDALWQGNLDPTLPALGLLARSGTKAVDAGSWLGGVIWATLAAELGWDELFLWNWNRAAGTSFGLRGVSGDPARRLFDAGRFMREHFDTEASPGPVGHGFTPRNLETGETWWAQDVGPGVRLVGLDTCNHRAGANGSLVEPQFSWLERELVACSSRYYDRAGRLCAGSGPDKLVVVASHHVSWQMDNLTWDPKSPFRRYDGTETVELLARFPNVVLWVNGHTHRNTLVAHRSPHEAGAGFWEVNTASCVDFGQQGRLVDVVDNGDGTLSVFVVTLDHAAPPDPGTGPYTSTRLASASRELSANDNYWRADRTAARGAVEDRNCELVLKRPFAPDVRVRGALAASTLVRRARLAAASPVPEMSR